jgi:uncharacterized protein YcbK (DUF882 family)
LRARQRASAAAVLACALALLFTATGAAAEADRTLSLYNIHTKETLTSTYKKNGKYVPEEMQKINWILRDWRKDQATTMDPGLIDLLWEIHAELGSKGPIHIISGYRSRETNDMLRRTVGGQASQSRHILGMAADVHFPDIPLKLLRYSALIRERGGVGYYPTSNIPFVHVDVDRVRAWPRLPRAELALLFPSGRTQHVPQDGRPITPADVREARAKNADMVAQIDEFRAFLKRPRSPVMAASLMPPLPKLLREPELVLRPLSKTALTPDAKTGETEETAAVVAAPEYDEEHPDELSYRPFPIAALLTATASADDPALAVLTHPDLSKVLELMDTQDALPPLQLRAGVYDAPKGFASLSEGVPVDLSALAKADDAKSRPPEGRKVAGEP